MNFFALALHTRSAGLADNTLLFDEVRQRCRINEAALAANAASTELRRDSKDRIALRDYNFALSRVFTVIRDSHLNPWAHPLRLPGPGGEYVLTHPPHGNRFWNPQDFDLIPADELDVRGKFVLPRITRNGVGASLVAVRSEQSPETRQQFVAARVYFAITAVVQFSGRRCEIEFMDPLAVETANVLGRSLPSAADFTAPLALGLSRERLLSLIPYKKVSREKVKLPKRSKQGAYDDEAALKGRRFVPVKY